MLVRFLAEEDATPKKYFWWICPFMIFLQQLNSKGLRGNTVLFKTHCGFRNATISDSLHYFALKKKKVKPSLHEKD